MERRAIVTALPLLAALVGVSPRGARAQGVDGAILGAVLDSAGHGLAGAEVTARNASTGAVWSVRTSSTGRYTYTVNENLGVLQRGGTPYQIQLSARYIY